MLYSLKVSLCHFSQGRDVCHDYGLPNSLSFSLDFSYIKFLCHFLSHAGYKPLPLSLTLGSFSLYQIIGSSLATRFLDQFLIIIFLVPFWRLLLLLLCSWLIAYTYLCHAKCLTIRLFSQQLNLIFFPHMLLSTCQNLSHLT